MSTPRPLIGWVFPFFTCDSARVTTALDRDPTSADAEAELADTYLFQVKDSSVAPAVGFERARRAATNALKRDPQNVLAHAVTAEIHIVYDWDWAGAERELQQAATLAPGNLRVLMGEVELSTTLGRWDDALRQAKAALALDPMSPLALNALSNVQWDRGHLPEAEAAARRVLDIRPTFSYGHYHLGLLLLERDDRDAALYEMQQKTTDEGKQEGLAIVYHALGRKTDSDAAPAGTLKNQVDGNALDIADVYAFRGQANEAMHWLERTYAQRGAYLYDIKSDGLLKGLRADSRYKALLRKMNLPE